MTDAPPPNPDRFRVAIVGGGPAGFFAADELLKAPVPVEVDLFERLAFPYGLVRYGVAPDHPEIRRVSRQFERVLEHDAFRLFGGIEIGCRIPVPSMREAYHAVILCTGMPQGRTLGIPGENLDGSYSSVDFVGWYTGHPDHAGPSPRLDHPDAVVIGNGNVAIDVARVLARPSADLAGFDLPDPVLEALAAKAVERVWVVGRRGPAQAAYAQKEINHLRSCVPVWFEGDPDNPDAVVRFLFLRSIEEVLGDAGRVAGVRCARNRLVGEGAAAKAVPTGETERIPCGLVVRCIGYRGLEVKGVPWDAASGTIPNRAGRVEPGLYTAGWIQHGPRGLIGTTRKAVRAIAREILADLPGLRRDLPEYWIEETLTRLGIRAVSKQEWKILDQIERRRGHAKNKERDKFLTTEEALRACARRSL